MTQKPLDSINVRATALVAIALFCSLFQNPAFTKAAVDLFTHPNPQTIVTALTAIAGVLALYIAKPVGVSDAPAPNPTPPQEGKT